MVTGEGGIQWCLSCTYESIFPIIHVTEEAPRVEEGVLVELEPGGDRPVTLKILKIILSHQTFQIMEILHFLTPHIHNHRIITLSNAMRYHNYRNITVLNTKPKLKHFSGI